MPTRPVASVHAVSTTTSLKKTCVLMGASAMSFALALAIPGSAFAATATASSAEPASVKHAVGLDTIKADQAKVKSNDERRKSNDAAIKIDLDKLKADQAKLKADQEKLKADEDELATDQATLAADQQVVDQDLAKANPDAADLDKLKADQDKVKADQDKVQADQDKIKADQDEVKADQDLILLDLARLKADQDKAKRDDDEAKVDADKLKKDQAKLDLDRADPRGNNGTFKVDGVPFDTSHGEESQIGCAGFRLNFFGYDLGQRANVTFTGVAPSRGGVLKTYRNIQISDTPAGGGKDLERFHVPGSGALTAAALGLAQVAPAKHGYHVKVSVEALNADGSDVPGGAKTKVFWIEQCAVASGTGTQAGSRLTPGTRSAALGARSAVLSNSLSAAGVGGTSGLGVLSGSVSNQSQLAGGYQASPATLPFTGSDGLMEVFVIGLSCIGAGVLMITQAQRRPGLAS